MDAVNPKTAWYRAHKNDESLRESMRQASKRYYEKNRDKERARCLARYYRLKGLPSVPTN